MDRQCSLFRQTSVVSDRLFRNNDADYRLPYQGRSEQPVSCDLEVTQEQNLFQYNNIAGAEVDSKKANLDTNIIPEFFKTKEDLSSIERLIVGSSIFIIPYSLQRSA